MSKPAWILGASIGLLLPEGTLAGAIPSLMITFFGLVAAGVLPAISLLVGNVLSPTRSVARLLTLKQDLDTLLNRLFQILGTLTVGALFAVLLELDLPSAASAVASAIPSLAPWVGDPVERLVQAGALAATLSSVDRLRVVKLAFEEVLKARYELAIEEARRRTEERAPKAADVSAAFPTSPDFGKKVLMIPPEG